jgi:antitoxin PrlF
MKATVAERGQVTIPKILRQKLGIKPGSILDFEIKDAKLIAIKINQQDPVSQVYGCLKKVVDTDTIMHELRDTP